MSDLNIFHLTKQWFKFCKSGDKIVRPIHSAFYYYCIFLCNELHWKINFSLPTDDTMAALGMKNKKTYYLILQDMVDFGFIVLTEKSINQHTANIIRLPKKRISNVSGTGLSTVPIVKRKDTKTLVYVSDDEKLTTGIVTIFKKQRPEIPLEVLIQEAISLRIKFTQVDLKKDVALFISWAKRIKYAPPIKAMDEFTRIEAENLKKYGG